MSTEIPERRGANKPKKIEDGGAAFPRATEQTVMGFPGTLEGERGLTMRDYFAAKVIQGQASLPDERIMVAGGHSQEEVEKWRQELLEYDVAYAYRVDDIAMKVRNK